MKLLAGDLPTGVASTFISPDGERTFGTYLGAAATMKAENLTLDMFKGYAYLYIEGYLVQDHELILRAMQLGKEAGLQICLDMASYNIVEGDLEFFDILITKYVDIVFANEEEAKAYTGKDAWGAINEIASKCSVVIVKLGAQGSCIKKGTECIKLEVPPVKRSWIPLVREIIMQQVSVWADLWLFFGEVFHYRFYFSIQCDTSGGYNLIKEKMGRNKVKYRGPSTGLNRIMY